MRRQRLEQPEQARPVFCPSMFSRILRNPANHWQQKSRSRMRELRYNPPFADIAVLEAGSDCHPAFADIALGCEALVHLGVVRRAKRTSHSQVPSERLRRWSSIIRRVGWVATTNFIRAATDDQGTERALLAKSSDADFLT